MANNFPISIPFGGGGDREMISVTKDKNQAYLNLIAKARLDTQDGPDIAIILGTSVDDKGIPDEGTIHALDPLLAGTIAIGGRGRAEHIMVKTNMTVPSWGPIDDLSPRPAKKDKQKSSIWSRNGKNGKVADDEFDDA